MALPNVTVEAPVRPSEDPDKVKRAMLNIFPDLEVAEHDGMLVGRGRSVQLFASLLKRQKIRDAARGILLRGKRSDRLTGFRLNKQAAFVGKVSFAESESPLGDLFITLEDDSLDLVINDLAPDTRPYSARGPAGGKCAQGKGAGRGCRTVVEKYDWKKEIKGFEEE